MYLTCEHLSVKTNGVDTPQYFKLGLADLSKNMANSWKQARDMHARTRKVDRVLD